MCARGGVYGSSGRLHWFNCNGDVCLHACVRACRDEAELVMGLPPLWLSALAKHRQDGDEAQHRAIAAVSREPPLNLDPSIFDLTDHPVLGLYPSSHGVSFQEDASSIVTDFGLPYDELVQRCYVLQQEVRLSVCCSKCVCLCGCVDACGVQQEV